MNRFCTGCQQFRRPEDGKKEKRGKVTRWICNWCLARKNISIYQSKVKE